MYRSAMVENDGTVMELERTYRQAERAARLACFKSKESRNARAVLASVVGFLRNAFRRERRVSSSARKRLSY